MPEMKDVLGVTPLLAFFIIAALVTLRLMPVWLAHKKELKLREFETRSIEAKARSEQAGALEALAGSVGQLSGTLRDIAIEQRRATDTIKILQRVNADSAQSLNQNVTLLGERLDRLEGQENADTQRTGTAAH